MTEPLSVALLQCDHVDPSLRQVAGDYDNMFARLFSDHAPEITLERVDVVGGEPLPRVGEHAALLITGSRHSTTDDFPWVGDLTHTIHEAHAAQVPLVGICFGHQLLAQALGGVVERAEVGWGVGVHDAEVVEPRWWMQPPRPGFRLLVSHQDQVVTPPTDAVVVATSRHAPIAAFEVGTAIGFQGHPEFVVDYADALMDRRLERIGADVVAQARPTLRMPTDHAIVARWIATFLARRDLARRDPTRRG